MIASSLFSQLIFPQGQSSWTISMEAICSSYHVIVVSSRGNLLCFEISLVLSNYVNAFQALRPHSGSKPVELETKLRCSIILLRSSFDILVFELNASTYRAFHTVFFLSETNGRLKNTVNNNNKYQHCQLIGEPTAWTGAYNNAFNKFCGSAAEHLLHLDHIWHVFFKCIFCLLTLYLFSRFLNNRTC